MENDRSWMYVRFNPNDPRSMSAQFLDGVDYFLEYAFSRNENIILENGVECIKCPCNECQNVLRQNREVMARHLVHKGFVGDYTIWRWHGETSVTINSHSSGRMAQMINEAAGPDFNMEEEAENAEVNAFFDMLHAADEPLWDGLACSRENRLSAVSLLLNLKTEFDLSQACYDRMIYIIRDKLLPENNRLPENYYESKKMLNGLGMGNEKYDVCRNNCMFFYGENAFKLVCDKCEEPRFKETRNGQNQKPIPYKVMCYLPITPRLQMFVRSSLNGIRKL